MKSALASNAGLSAALARSVRKDRPLVLVGAPDSIAVPPAPVSRIGAAAAATAAAPPTQTETNAADTKADAAPTAVAAMTAVTAAAVSAATAAMAPTATAAMTPTAAVTDELHVRLFVAFTFFVEDVESR